MNPAFRLHGWTDLPRIDPQGLAALQGALPAQDLLARLIDLSRRLPCGLIHAEAVHVHANPPTGLAPLGPGSAWYALDRSLLVAVDLTDSSALDRLIGDLTEYAALSSLLARAAASDPELPEASVSTDLTAAALRLTAVLQTSTEQWQRLAQRAPGLREDLRAMLHGAFEAPIHLHPHVRPGWLADAGRVWADALHAACPSDRPWVVVSEGPETVELLSPYVRDLASALGQWAVENPDQIRVQGLTEAWTTAPDDDLAAMVIPDLLRTAHELSAERRSNEQTQGLFLEDRLGTQAGYAEIERLAAPDRRAVPSGARAVALLAAGGPAVFRTAMVEQWVARGLAGLAAVFRSDAEGTMPVIPTIVADEADAFVLPGTDVLIADAAELGTAVVARDVLHVSGQRSSTVSRVLGRVRRAQLCDEVDGQLPVHVVFAPREPRAGQRTTEVQRAAFDAARLVLRRAWWPATDRQARPKGPPIDGRPKGPTTDGRPRRFRA